MCELRLSPAPDPVGPFTGAWDSPDCLHTAPQPGEWRGRGRAALAGGLCPGRLPGLETCGLGSGLQKTGAVRSQEEVCTSHSGLTEKISKVLSDFQSL